MRSIYEAVILCDCIIKYVSESMVALTLVYSFMKFTPFWSQVSFAYSILFFGSSSQLKSDLKILASAILALVQIR